MATLPALLVDSMIVIEAARTSCWNAITGQRRVVTVEECAKELRRGDTGTPGYVRVTDQDVTRMTVEPLRAEAAAAFRLAYPAADGLDPGERDLLAHATTRSDDFQVCSCDKAAVAAAHALGWLSPRGLAGGGGPQCRRTTQPGAQGPVHRATNGSVAHVTQARGADLMPASVPGLARPSGC